MESRLYREMARAENHHWWFVSRRRIIEAVLETRVGRAGPGSVALDAGCGTGGNLELLSRFGFGVVGMEPEPRARELAAARSGKRVVYGRLPDDIPFPHNCFDLIVLLDVLEHVQEDEAALKELALRLRPGGSLLVTVPAFQFLWSGHDEAHYHHRRYVLREVVGKMARSGLTLEYASYYNFFLFPVIAAVRGVRKRLKRRGRLDDLAEYPRLLNTFLAGVMSCEARLLRHLSLPFGVSIIALGKKP